ncbi:MAG: hypothetical protein M3401_17075 [Actinomycetota bacterium]|nr:hypothetical protein [Actinomycetota bacterium]
MKFSTTTIALAAAFALSAVPAFALPPQVPSNQGTAHIPDNQGTQHAPDNPGPPATPGPNASPKAKAKAYGTYCKTQSKKHVKGQKGTPFSLCVTAMAKLANGQTSSPSKACKAESRKHIAGQKGTPFSKCVVAGAKLLKDQAQT